MLANLSINKVNKFNSKKPGKGDIIVGSAELNEVRIFDSKNSYQPCA